MKRLLLPLLALSALLSACVPAPLRAQNNAQLQLSATLAATPLRVDDGKYRRPGPSTLNVRVTGEAAYLYALWLPEGGAARVLTPARQPASSGQMVSVALPPTFGFNQVFVVGSSQPLNFGALGSSVNALADAAKNATAKLPAGSWNTTNLAYRVNDYGTVVINSRPQDVNVYLDGNYQGSTPLRLNAAEVGSRTLQLRREGYFTLTRPITVLPDQTTRVQAVLQPDLNYRRTIPGTQPAPVIDNGGAGQ